MAPITPTLQPIPDEDVPSPGRINLQQNNHSATNSTLIQMPQPRKTPRHHTPSTILSTVQLSTSPKTTTTTTTNTTPRLRPSSSHPILTSPSMTRAHSSPSIYSPVTPVRSGSPLRSPNRVRSPFRHLSADEIYTLSSNSTTTLSPDISIISEDRELEITPRSRHSSMSSLSVPATSALSGHAAHSSHSSHSSHSGHSSHSNYSSHSSHTGISSRRAVSPLRSVVKSRASSVPASPVKPHGRYNESFPSDLPYSRSLFLTFSSVPSTPTSARSRSPSISSLETIPDTPDEENRALEQDRKDREERRRIWEFGSSSQSAIGGSSSLKTGSGFNARDKRKRWSVCGAEKRGDLNLETIWED